MSKIHAVLLFIAMGQSIAAFGQEATPATKTVSLKPSTLPVVVIVQDVERARHFYADVLGQKINMASPRYVTFERGFSLWQADSAAESVGEEAARPLTASNGGYELVFESDEIEPLQAKLEAAQVKFVHKIKEQPWGQRVLRFYDPDGHMAEVGEPMDVVVRRFLKQGMSVEDVSKRTVMPLDVVKRIASEK